MMLKEMMILVQFAANLAQKSMEQLKNPKINVRFGLYCVLLTALTKIFVEFSLCARVLIIFPYFLVTIRTLNAEMSPFLPAVETPHALNTSRYLEPANQIDPASKM